MSNHFHLLCEVPVPRPLSQSEVLERIEALYGPQRVQALQEQLASSARQPDGFDQSNRLLEPFRRRMYDISTFMKKLKGGFTQGFNRRHGRYGTLWAERFKSVLLEPGQAVVKLAAYIDLNPVRAGLCADPKEYRYCGYAEALAKGAAGALEGIRVILGLPQTTSPEQLSAEYRKHLFLTGAVGTENNPPAFDLARRKRLLSRSRANSRSRNGCAARFGTLAMEVAVASAGPPIRSGTSRQSRARLRGHFLFDLSLPKAQGGLLGTGRVFIRAARAKVWREAQRPNGGTGQMLQAEFLDVCAAHI
jgi:hypothetical protein